MCKRSFEWKIIRNFLLFPILQLRHQQKFKKTELIGFLITMQIFLSDARDVLVEAVPM